MTKLVLLILCAQALLVQNAFGQALLQQYNPGFGYGGVVSSGCGNNLVQSVVGPVASQVQVGNVVSNVGNVVTNVDNYAFSGNNGGFGGNGVGQLGIVGELPIMGSTYVDGNLPVIGVVEFNGALPAGGFVSVVGNTPCQCGNYGLVL